MKTLSLSLTLVLCVLPVLASAQQLIGGRRSLPPAYLGVTEWKHCAASIRCGSAQYVCLPQLKPGFCPYTSWRQLKDKQLLSDCTAGCTALGSTGKKQHCKKNVV